MDPQVPAGQDYQGDNESLSLACQSWLAANYDTLASTLATYDWGSGSHHQEELQRIRDETARPYQAVNEVQAYLSTHFPDVNLDPEERDEYFGAGEDQGDVPDLAQDLFGYQTALPDPAPFQPPIPDNSQHPYFDHRVLISFPPPPPAHPYLQSQGLFHHPVPNHQAFQFLPSIQDRVQPHPHHLVPNQVPHCPTPEPAQHYPVEQGLRLGELHARAQPQPGKPDDGMFITVRFLSY